MDTCVKSEDLIKQSSNGGSLNSFWINISTWQLLDRLLFLIKPVAEYALGMHIGFALGWLIGFYTGYSYVKHLEPVYFDNLGELTFWKVIPHMFARFGAFAGLIIGILAIVIINIKLLSRRIIILYEKGITNPSQIAKLLDRSVGQIKRNLNKLIKKGRISRNSP